MKFKPNIQLFANPILSNPADGIGGRRDIDRLWLDNQIMKKALRSNMGLDYDDSILYIQDEGQKTAGKIYIDKLDGKAYECIDTTSTVSNTSEYFKPMTIKDVESRIPFVSLRWQECRVVFGDTSYVPEDQRPSLENYGMNAVEFDITLPYDVSTPMCFGYVMTSTFAYGNASGIRMGLISMGAYKNGSPFINTHTLLGASSANKWVTVKLLDVKDTKKLSFQFITKDGYNTHLITFFKPPLSEIPINVSGYSKVDTSQIPEDKWF